MPIFRKKLKRKTANVGCEIDGSSVSVPFQDFGFSDDMSSSSNYKPDELIVNYHDACIYGRDLALVESSRAWLNDAVIHFYLSVLQHSQQPPPSQQQAPSLPSTNNNNNNNQDAASDHTIFLDPSVISFLMHQCHDDEDLMEFAAGACGNFDAARHLRLVIPMNDHFGASANAWAIPGAGMHWSLLIMSYITKEDNATVSHAWHLDSHGGNASAAKAVARKIHHARSLVRNDSSSTNQQSAMSTKIKPPSVHECQVPQQQNGHDCGIHVLAAAEALWPLPPSEWTTASIEETLAKTIDLTRFPGFCGDLRSKIAACIRAEGARQQGDAS